MGIHQFRNRIIKDVSPYVDFVDSFCGDPNFSDPHLLMKQEKEESIIDWIDKTDRPRQLVLKSSEMAAFYYLIHLNKDRTYNKSS